MEQRWVMMRFTLPGKAHQWLLEHDYAVGNLKTVHDRRIRKALVQAEIKKWGGNGYRATLRMPAMDVERVGKRLMAIGKRHREFKRDEGDMLRRFEIHGRVLVERVRGKSPMAMDGRVDRFLREQNT